MAPQELRAKFRVSELSLLGWRSQEQSAAMEKRFSANRPDFSPPSDTPFSVNPSGGVEPDCSKMTGKQMLHHLRSCGFLLPVVLPEVKRGSN